MEVDEEPPLNSGCLQITDRKISSICFSYLQSEIKYVLHDIQNVPKNVLTLCLSIVPRYEICLEHDRLQFEHRGTRRY
jgi:hypothetical protein